MLATVIFATVGLALPAGAAALTAPLPPDGDTAFAYSLQSVACPAAGGCVAAGYYHNSAGHQEIVLEQQTAGEWAASKPSLALAPDATGFAGPTYVACSAPGSCVATGLYEYIQDSVTHHSAMLVSETGGSWTPITELQQPTDVVTGTEDPEIELNDVSCAPGGACTAAGSYGADASQHGGSGEWQEPLVVTEVSGAWGRATNPGVPANAATDPDAVPFAISCPAAGDCTAVGQYIDSSGHEQGLLLTETNDVWSAAGTDLSGLGDAPYPNPGVQLNSVSCTSPGNCVAAGSYDDHNSETQALIMTEAGGTWTARGIDMTRLSASDGVYTNPGAGLFSASCTSAGNCAVVGDYQIASGHFRGLLVTEAGGVWEPAVTVDPPAGAAGTNIDLFFDHPQSVACPADGTCVADGYYQGDGASAAGIVLRVSGTTLTSASIPLATGSEAPDDSAGAVSCGGSGYCAIAAEDLTATTGTAFTLNAPGPVGGLAASAGSGQATVTWSAPSDDGGLPITGYTVTATDTTASSRGGQSVSVGTSATGAALTGLTPGDAYTFTVTASNLLGVGVGASSAGVTIPSPHAVQPTRTRLLATLAKILTPTGRQATRSRILANRGFTLKYTALEAGRLRIAWSYNHTTGSGKHRTRHRTLVASANVRITRAKTVVVKLRLTRIGTRLLRANKRLKLLSSVMFTPTGHKTIEKTKTFTLH